MEKGDNTKRKIFEASTELFSLRGYDSVPIVDIAAKAEIAEGTIYRHYKNKESILNSILEEYSRKMKKHLLSKKQVDKYIETSTPKELLEMCVWRFGNDEKGFMTNASRIAFREQYVNKRAKRILKKDIHQQSIDCIKYVLDRLIEKNSIPDMDTTTFSVAWVRIILYAVSYWSVSYLDDDFRKQVENENERMFRSMLDTALTGKI